MTDTDKSSKVETLSDADLDKVSAAGTPGALGTKENKFEKIGKYDPSAQPSGI